MNFIRSITLWHGIIAAVIAIALAMFVIRGGILNSILWLVGIAAVVIGVINQISYGGAYRG